MKNSEKNAKQLKIAAKINNIFPEKKFQTEILQILVHKMNNGAKLLGAAGAGAPAVYLVL